MHDVNKVRDEKTSPYIDTR